jgi:hypothetical protein
MPEVSIDHRTHNWDIARLPADEGRSGQAAWAETYGARALGLALTDQPEFWDHVARARGGESALTIARQYMRRDQSRRAELVAVYLERAAEAEPHDDHRFEKAAVWSIGQRAWWVDGELEAGQPRRNLRRDAIETIRLGAKRVARRGARRCADPGCTDPHGRRLAKDNETGYCGPCATRDRRASETDEAERALFDAATAAVLGAVAEDRPRSRRRRRSQVAAAA